MQADFNDENLVAYLDGELPSEEAAAVENAVKSNAELQQRVSSLRTSWELLGDLPDEEYNPQLAQSTIEMVSLAIEQESRTWWGWLRLNRLAALGLCCLLALLAGVAYGRVKSHLESRDLLSNLHVMLESPALKYIPSVEFLEILASIENLLDFPAQAPEDVRLEADQMFAWTLDERQAWVEGLDPAERQQLSSMVQRYGALTVQEREKNSRILDYIIGQEKRMPELFQAARAYHAMIDRAGTRAVLSIDEAVKQSPEALIAAINEELAFLYELSAEDRQAIHGWWNDFMDSEFEMSTFSPADLGNDYIIYRLSITDPDSEAAIPDEWIDRLHDAMSGRAFQLLSDVQDPARRRAVIGFWVSSAIHDPSTTPEPLVDASALRKRFDELPKMRQDQLYILPGDTVRKQLSAPASLPNR